jgi:hypothetical protein
VIGSAEATVTLYRPVGQAEVDLIRASGFRASPRRLPSQMIYDELADEVDEAPAARHDRLLAAAIRAEALRLLRRRRVVQRST